MEREGLEAPVVEFFFRPGAGGRHSGVPPAPRISMISAANWDDGLRFGNGCFN
jgi:hypothetical protein